jgi:hypothetical protein
MKTLFKCSSINFIQIFIGSKGEGKEAPDGDAEETSSAI